MNNKQIKFDKNKQKSNTRNRVKIEYKNTRGVIQTEMSESLKPFEPELDHTRGGKCCSYREFTLLILFLARYATFLRYGRLRFYIQHIFCKERWLFCQEQY